MPLKIGIKGERGRFYANNMHEPVLIVNDLKHGGIHSGSVGIWSCTTTEAYFANLTVVTH